MTKVRIPATIEEARTALASLDALLTAKEWHRAAIVFAFTRSEMGRGDKVATSGDFRLTISAFAALGIAGLKSHTTVEFYRKAWQTAIDDGQAIVVAPGDTVTLPNRGWPPNPKQHTPTKTEAITSIRKLLHDDPAAAVAELIQDSPQTISELAEGISKTPAVRAMVREMVEEEVERELVPWPPSEPDYSKDLRTAANALQRLLAARRDGRWEPDEMEQTLIAFIAQAFNEMAGGKSSDVINEIEAFLAVRR